MFSTKYHDALVKQLHEVRRENLRLRDRLHQVEALLDDSIDAEVNLKFSLEEVAEVSVS